MPGLRQRFLTIALPVIILAASAARAEPVPVPLAPEVDLPRFMGDWYVIAHIPPSVDRDAHNAVESYRLDGDRIATTYRRRPGSFDAAESVSKPVGRVVDGSGNALWGMRFFWWLPIWFEYRIAYLAPDYSVTIIARSKRDYVWLMSRKPVMDDEEYSGHIERIKSWGYDTSRVIRVPQRWPT
jgi:apolipoprotein D and lipocalin family protein